MAKRHHEDGRLEENQARPALTLSGQGESHLHQMSRGIRRSLSRERSKGRSIPNLQTDCDEDQRERSVTAPVSPPRNKRRDVRSLSASSVQASSSALNEPHSDPTTAAAVGTSLASSRVGLGPAAPQTPQSWLGGEGVVRGLPANEDLLTSSVSMNPPVSASPAAAPLVASSDQ